MKLSNYDFLTLNYNEIIKLCDTYQQYVYLIEDLDFWMTKANIELGVTNDQFKQTSLTPRRKYLYFYYLLKTDTELYQHLDYVIKNNHCTLIDFIIKQGALMYIASYYAAKYNQSKIIYRLLKNAESTIEYQDILEWSLKGVSFNNNYILINKILKKVKNKLISNNYSWLLNYTLIGAVESGNLKIFENIHQHLKKDLTKIDYYNSMNLVLEFAVNFNYLDIINYLNITIQELKLNSI